MRQKTAVKRSGRIKAAPQARAGAPVMTDDDGARDVKCVEQTDQIADRL